MIAEVEYATLNANSQNTCIVCYKNVKIFSIGNCEHPVCYECSTRMRVLCQQNECPICRQDLPKVVFTEDIKPFRHLKKTNLFDSKYNIYFENEKTQHEYNTLLAHSCNNCKIKEVFGTFKELETHMRQKHELYYCALCVENLKIFSNERRCYSRTDLAYHRRKGDIDDKSHKGHPLCEFCDERYMDNDELYRHLRRDHLYCHFCDADGFHHYYRSYTDLRDHFKKEHFLCEEGTCVEEQFTSVYRSEIDLKAHKANVHCRQLGRAALRQARTLELEFTLTPRGDGRNNNRRLAPMPKFQNRNHPNQDVNEHVPPEPSINTDMTFVRPQPEVDVQSTEQFPTLGNIAPVIPVVSQGKSRGNLTIRSTRRLGQSLISDEDFPALGSFDAPSCSGISNTVNLSVSQVQSSSGPNVSIHVNHKSNGTAVTTRVSGNNIRIRPSRPDFPALSGSSNIANAAPKIADWTKVTARIKPNSKQEHKSRNPAPAPLISTPPAIQSGEDFPSLKPKSNKSSTISIVPSQAQTSEPRNNASISVYSTKSKTKKKKNNKQANLSNTDVKNPEVFVQCISNPRRTDDAKKTGKKIKNNIAESNVIVQSLSKPKQTDDAKKNGKKIKTNSEEPEVIVQCIPNTNQTDDDTKKNPRKINNTSEENISRQMNFLDLNVGSLNSGNNIQRKRSELKIDNLNPAINNVIRNEDFPALGNSGINGPPSLSKPPPGFIANPASSPPPGFSLKNVNDNRLTFTNSSGESYSIVPNNNELKTYAYLPPPDFQNRNKSLVASVSNALRDENSIKEFKFLSELYRQGICDVQEFYIRCQLNMGISTFQQIFPELLLLLPDIKKQRELFNIHKQEVNGKIRNLDECITCGQIVRSSELKVHMSCHTKEPFPPLGIATHSSNNWARK